MSWEIIFVIILLVLAIVSYVMEKIPTDLTSWVVFAALMAGAMITGSEKLPDVSALLNVFASPAPITIAAMFVISTALERCGAIESLANLIGNLSGFSYKWFLLIMVFAVAIFSAFINNTPVVVVLLPVVLSLAKRMNLPASKLLIPLSYASIFGGICTAIGTSTNILVSGVLVKQEMEPLSMFELSAVGLPLLVVAACYLLLFGDKLLPVRETLTSILSEEERKEYITEAFVPHESSLVGQTAGDAGLVGKSSIRLLEIVRNGVAVYGNIKKIVLEEGDRLILACRPSGIMEARRLEGINFVGDGGFDLEQIAAHEGAIVEGVIGPRSTILGQTMRETNFRQRYRMIILAVHRQGKNLREKLETLQLQFGDTLLMMGTNLAIENMHKNDDIILLDRPPVPAQDMSRKKIIVLCTLVALITFISLGVPIVGVTVVAVAVIAVTGCIKLKTAYQSIEWSILMLIFGMLALGMAMETSGLTANISNMMVTAANELPPESRPYIMLGLMYLCTSILTELLSNNATAVLMAPIAISLAVSLQVDPRPFVIAICVASSASFATPIGYQTNTYVYGVGGYRFADFLKIGIPLNLIYFAGSMILIPLMWPFSV